VKKREKLIKTSTGQFFRIINMVNSRERMPLDCGTDELLYMGEIHMIDTIGKNSGINVTRLAEALGVTKGAVSQMVSKLVRRDYLLMTSREGIGNEVSLELTPKGRTAYSGHEKYHSVTDQDLFKDIKNEELIILINILSKIEVHFDSSKK
jgi:DNA-binding MarR family transcriptional regulator